MQGCKGRRRINYRACRSLRMFVAPLQVASMEANVAGGLAHALLEGGPRKRFGVSPVARRSRDGTARE